ncbi:MAG: glycoside hydrolase family 3 C-terminal domain-containing protein [Lachnospiraceae bacterium]|nr:glycoside hydrolase family 3 C-terminal domain-containing protein [Lachnospiraceae bacterium]
MEKWARAKYQPNLPLKEGQHVTASKEHITLSKEAAKEGMVLLKNDKNLLPLRAGSRVALFGKGSFDYVKGGGGSGDVTVSYVRNLYDGLKFQEGTVTLYEPLSDFYRNDVKEQYTKGAAPGMTVEPSLPDELVAGAKAFADTAIICISRFSGEGWDRSSVEYNGEYNPWETETSMPQIAGEIFEDGDFYLTRKEKEMIQKVKDNFTKVAVVLNIGGIIDTTWFKEDDAFSSVLVAWQAGMEGGLAAAELLCGKASPSGKLPDTFARRLEDYPSTENFHESPHYVDYTEDIYVGYRYFETIPGADSKVCYPFGFGLSYTQFEIVPQKALIQDDVIRITVQVTNIGKAEGKEVVQVYYSAPQGILQKPRRELAAFAKTRSLMPGESQTIVLEFAKNEMASYDDLGKVAESAYVLEEGTYEFYVGNSVRDTSKLDFALTLTESEVVEQLSRKAAPTSLKKRMLADGSYEELPLSQANDPDECVLVKMESGTEEALTPSVRGRESYLLLKPYAEGARPLIEVAEGKMTMEEFAAQLSDEDLIHLLGGQPNTSTANTFGYGNLPEYGVPNIMTADGPAGLRICLNTTAWPCATLLASTWNTELVEQVGVAGAEEVKENNIAVWLTPAVNIHRNPYCGRNFEYYSEDPYLTGKMGISMVKGIQSQHIAAAVKHFACNNKETNRKHSDSRVSERALREIYLKGFEMIVKEADPWVIMSAYNMINGHRASENHELLEDILRGEWGFKGMVTSDWWTRGEHYKEIKAGNDVKMACGFPERVKEAMEKGAVDRDDLIRCAKRVLGLILKID